MKSCTQRPGRVSIQKCSFPSVVSVHPANQRQVGDLNPEPLTERPVPFLPQCPGCLNYLLLKSRLPHDLVCSYCSCGSQGPHRSGTPSKGEEALLLLLASLTPDTSEIELEKMEMLTFE